jgi:hypothetical protein
MGVGAKVGVGKAVGDGISVGAMEAVCVAVGIRAVPHPVRKSEINVTVVKVRSIWVSKTLFVILYYQCQK